MRSYALRRTLTVVPVLLGVSDPRLQLRPPHPRRPRRHHARRAGDAREGRRGPGAARPGPADPRAVPPLSRARSLRGDLGVSIVRGDPVLTDILRRFPATVELAVAAIVLAALVGIPIGIVSAVWRKSLVDSLSACLALTGVSMPIFWLGVMLAWVFAVELRLAADRRPARQRGRLRAADPLRHAGRGPPAQLGDDPGRAPPLVLPAVALATIPLAVIARMMRASMLEVLSRDYIRTADAKGLSRAAVVLRHGLRNALLPVLTVVGLAGRGRSWRGRSSPRRSSPGLGSAAGSTSRSSRATTRSSRGRASSSGSSWSWSTSRRTSSTPRSTRGSSTTDGRDDRDGDPRRASRFPRPAARARRPRRGAGSWRARWRGPAS